MASGKVSRRGFIAGAGATAGLAFLGAAQSASASEKTYGDGPFRGELPDGTALVSGVIEQLSGTDGFVIQGSPAVAVILGADVRLWRDGPASLEDFRRGDSVSVQGRWASQDSFVARIVEPMYFDVSGAVESVSGGVITTTGGSVRVGGSTLVMKPAGGSRALRNSDIAPGASIQVIARRESGDPPLVAVRVVPAS